MSVLPSAALTLVFFAVPLALLIYYSFGTQAFLSTDVEVGPTFEQYELVFGSEYFSTLLRTLAVAVGTAVICVLVGLPLAYMIARRAGKYEGLLLVLIMVPFWTSFLIRTYAWTNILGSGGPINEFLLGVGIVQEPVQMLFTLPAVTIGMVYTYLPFAVLPIYAVMRSLDEQILDAAADLGASSWAAFRQVTLPIASPGIIAGFILVLIPAMGEFIVPQILGGGKTLLLGNLIASQFGSSFNWPLGAALAVVGLLAVAAVAALVSLLRRSATMDGQTSGRTGSMRRIGIGAGALLAGYLGFLYVPLVIVAVNAFNADPTLAGWGGATTEWVTTVLRDQDFLTALRNSLFLATLSTAFSVAIGTTGAMWLARRGVRARRVLLPLVMVRLVLPEVVLATALLIWLSVLAFPRGVVTAAIGQTVFSAALVTVIVLSRLDGRGRATDEAAEDLYANAWQRSWRVTLPEISPAIAASALLAFTLAFDDVVTPFFLAGSGFLTLPVLVLAKVRFAIGPEVNAIALMMMLVTAVPILLALLLRRHLIEAE